MTKGAKRDTAETKTKVKLFHNITTTCWFELVYIEMDELYALSSNILLVCWNVIKNKTFGSVSVISATVYGSLFFFLCRWRLHLFHS